MKQKRIAGMTLMELLCALAVVLLVSAGMVLGVSLAVRSYERSVTNSEAQVLCSNADSKYSRFITDSDGRVLLGGQKLLPNNAYPHGLRAAVELTDYDKATRIFTAVVTVTDRSGDTLAQTDFQVKQLNEPAEQT